MPEYVAHAGDTVASVAVGKASGGYRLPIRVGFVVASVALVLVFAVAGSPIPLFNTYRATNGISNVDLGMVSVGNFLAAAISLLVFGRISNHLGRRPVAIAALGVMRRSRSRPTRSAFPPVITRQ